MARRLFALLSALSLLLCVAAVALWVVSYFRSAAVVRLEQNAPASLELNKGWVILVLWERPPALRVATRRKWQYQSWPTGGFGSRVYTTQRHIPNATFRLRAVAFEVYRGKHYFFTVTTVRVPLWLLAAVAAGLPLSWLWSRRRRRHRAKHNLCSACGYDLTANVSGTCPECGRPTGPDKDAA